MGFDWAAYLGAAFAVGFGAIGSGVGEGWAAHDAQGGLTRQPAVSTDTIKTMLVGQAISESPGIFALVIAVYLVFREHPGSWPEAFAVIGAGLSVGLSGIGSGIGAGLAGGEACRSSAREPEAAPKITFTMLLGQAICTSPSIFGFVVALLLVFKGFPGGTVPQDIYHAAGALAAGLCMGVGAIGPGLGIGFVGMKACQAVGERLDAAGAVRRVLLIGAAVSESTSIYSFVIAALILFVL